MISEPCESDMRVPWRLRKTSIDRTIRVRTMNRMIEQKGAEVAENPSEPHCSNEMVLYSARSRIILPVPYDCPSPAEDFQISQMFLGEGAGKSSDDFWHAMLNNFQPPLPSSGHLLPLAKGRRDMRNDGH